MSCFHQFVVFVYFTHLHLVLVLSTYKFVNEIFYYIDGFLLFFHLNKDKICKMSSVQVKDFFFEVYIGML